MNRYLADIRSAANLGSSPCEVVIPTISLRVEQPNDLTGVLMPSSYIRSLVPIAMQTCQGCHTAVLTAALSPLPDLTDELRITSEDLSELFFPEPSGLLTE